MGFKLAGILFIVMLVMAAGFSYYYSDTQKRLQILNENNAKLETAVAISEETISSLQKSYEQASAELTTVSDNFNKIREQNQVLSDKLSKHDFGVLAERKPGLVVKIINSATDKVGRCFEILSGSPLTTKEKEAKSAKSFNSECPQLWPGSVTP